MSQIRYMNDSNGDTCSVAAVPSAFVFSVNKLLDQMIDMLPLHCQPREIKQTRTLFPNVRINMWPSSPPHTRHYVMRVMMATVTMARGH
jgi:hypothetical protein